MGLFDRLKSAFIKDKEKESVGEEVAQEEILAEELTEESAEKAVEEPIAIDAETSESIEELVTQEKAEEEKVADVPESEDSGKTLKAIDEEVEGLVIQEEVDEAVLGKNEAPTEEVEEITVEEPQVTQSEPEEVQEKYEKGLEKTRKTFREKMNELFASFRSVDEDFFEEVEEALIGADVGFETSIKITEQLRQEVKLKNIKKPAAVQNAIIEKLVDLYEEQGMEEVNDLNLQKEGVTVILFVGVNGVGKTTSIGKLAYKYRQEGKKVMLAAADTFRAGAIDQLVVWGERAGVEVVRGKAGGDPSAVVYDAMERAKAENVDILMIDTAGRLQNKVNLMNELDKMKRVIQKENPTAPHEVLLVLDATTGQNAMSQAKQFKETTEVTGLVLTKLDGTAKGGIVLAIRNELHLPVKLVGLGEGMTDLERFDSNSFVLGLFKELLQEE